MSIPVTCAGCGRTFRVKDKYAGKMGSCPFCAGTVRVPKVEMADEFDALHEDHVPNASGSLLNPVDVIICPRCQRRNLGGMPYCISCGTLLGETKPGG